MPHRPIGVFDSGVGGISVLKEIHRQLPGEDLIYVADSANAPYGSQSRKAILERCNKVTEFLLEQDIKSMVIACNTATAVAATVLRENFPALPIIGLEPAVKPAAQQTEAGVIGILATEQTIKSNRLKRLIEEYAQSVNTVKQACPGLVELVESGDFDTEKTHQLLDEYLESILDQQADVLVLGCTHYPFLRKAIREQVGEGMQIIETSIPVTEQLKRILKANQLDNSLEQGSVLFYSSDYSEASQATIKLLWQTVTQEKNADRVGELNSKIESIDMRPLPKPYC